MKAQPLPSVSGKYFFPKAPLLCLKCMPACADTSVNSIGPDGRGGVGLAIGEGVWFATSAGGAITGVADCLHADNKNNEPTRTHKIITGTADVPPAATASRALLTLSSRLDDTERGRAGRPRSQY